jgi:F420H(2)-dependent quinone reductase
MMAYRKPLLFTRKVFNPLAMRFGISGVKALAVRRRRSGTLQRVPLIAVERDGTRYLVSPRGETDWVRNLRAAGEAEFDAQRVRATEVPVAERPPIIAQYREVAGKAVASHFKALPDPADHPIFRLDAP